MDLLDVGTQCSHSSCNEIDFLPITCRCNRSFCRHHIVPDNHQCPIDLTVANSVSLQKLQRCAVETCTKLALSTSDIHPGTTGGLAACSQCRQQFCALHRHPEAHGCTDFFLQGNDPEKNNVARALLSKKFPPPSKTLSNSKTRRPYKIPTDPIKLAQYRKVELMKMRHIATPGDVKDKTSSPPQSQRINIQIDINDTLRRAFWFRRTMVTGKVLDCLASHVGISASDSSPLQLVKLSDTECVLRNDCMIGDEVEDGDILCVQRVNA